MQTDLREKEAVLQKKLDPESHFSAICPNESGNGGGTLQNAALPCGKIFCSMLQSGQKESSLPEGAVFLVNEDNEEEEARQENRYQRKNDAELIKEKPVKYGLIKKAVNRIKTGRWGEWDDLITEMDGQETGGHL